MKMLRQASISCSGFGDTDSHAVFEDPFHYLHGRRLTGNHCTMQGPPHRVLPNERSLNDSFDQVDQNMDWEAMQNTIPRIIVWSTMDQDGLKRLIAQYHRHFGTMTISYDARNRYPFDG